VPKEIVDLVGRFEVNEDIYKSSEYNEQEIREEFINPFFEALGWDVNNRGGLPADQKDVKPEDSIEVSGRIKNPDYSFRVNKKREFLVEAKRPSVNIEGGTYPAFQVRSYSWSAGLPISIVTDFEEFAVYDCRSEPSKADRSTKDRIMLVKYYQYEKRWDEIAALFSKEAVVSGSLRRLFQEVFVKTLPIRTIDFSDPQDVARHDRMVSLVERMLALHKQMPAAKTPQEQTALQRQIKATDKQIDGLVYELYGLTEDEIRIVEGQSS